MSSSCFSAIFAKGNNFSDFLVAFLDIEVLSTLGLLIKERIASRGAKS